MSEPGGCFLEPSSLQTRHGGRVLSDKSASATWAQNSGPGFLTSSDDWRRLVERRVAETSCSREHARTRARGAIQGRSVDVGIISSTHESIFNGADLQTLRHTRWVSSPRSSFFDAHVERRRAGWGGCTRSDPSAEATKCLTDCITTPPVAYNPVFLISV